MGGGPELWDVRVRRSAAKELRNLPNPEQGDVLDILEDLKEGRGDRYRLFYEVFPTGRRVSVTRIELRKANTYSGMDRW